MMLVALLCLFFLVSTLSCLASEPEATSGGSREDPGGSRGGAAVCLGLTLLPDGLPLPFLTGASATASCSQQQCILLPQLHKERSQQAANAANYTGLALVSGTVDPPSPPSFHPLWLTIEGLCHNFLQAAGTRFPLLKQHQAGHVLAKRVNTTEVHS